MPNSEEQVLEFLTYTAEAIANMFGPNCETAVYDMSKPGHPIVVIFNGHVSGRTVGSTAPAITSKARPYIRSTTINCTNQGFEYALGINFDYSPINAVIPFLKSFTDFDVDPPETDHVPLENQLDKIYEDCLKIINKPVSAMTKDDRLQLVSLLSQRGAFSFQKSISYIADRLNVSRYTIYKYLHELGFAL